MGDIKKMQICHCDNSMQLLTGFEDNSSFV